MFQIRWSVAWVRLKRSAGSTTSFSGVMFLLALTQQGCAFLAAERARFVEGWHPGRVVQVDLGAAMGPPFRSDCRSELPAQRVAQGHFVLVRYSVAPSRHAERIAPVPNAEAVRVGDRVYVNVNECRAPIKASAANQSSGVS